MSRPSAGPIAPEYETTVTVTVRYPGSSPEEAYALHHEIVGAIRDAAEALRDQGPDAPATPRPLRSVVATSDGPTLVTDREPPRR